MTDKPQFTHDYDGTQVAIVQGKCSSCGEWLDLWENLVDCHPNDANDDLCPGSDKPPTETRHRDTP